MRQAVVALALGAAFVCSPAQAQNARDILVSAAFSARDKASALERIEEAIELSDAAFKRNPKDTEARLQRALGISYRGKLNRSRADVLLARREFEAIAAITPRDPDVQIALASWHLGSVIELGPFAARTVLGARTATGMEALNRALTLGSNRPSIPALASMQHIQLEPADVTGTIRLAEAAVGGDANTAFDRVMQKQAAALLAILRKGNGAAAAALAKSLMPFGRITK